MHATSTPSKSLVTLSTYEERKEALKSTILMEDDASHRTIRKTPSKLPVQNTLQHLPPPPPEFANPQITPEPQKMPSYCQEPAPDYDNVQFCQPMAASMPSKLFLMQHSERRTSLSQHQPTGAITIGQYNLPARKEPSKLDFLASKHTEPSTSLRSELQNTLSRSNLNKTNGHHSSCQYQNLGNFKRNPFGSNVEQITRQLQGTTCSTNAPTTIKSPRQVNAPSSGILKNGNRHSGDGPNGYSRSNEKSISFGN